MLIYHSSVQNAYFTCVRGNVCYLDSHVHTFRFTYMITYMHTMTFLLCMVYAVESVSINITPFSLFHLTFPPLTHAITLYCDIFTWLMPHGLSLITMNVEEAGISEINRANKCFSKYLACQAEDILQSSFSSSFFPSPCRPFPSVLPCFYLVQLLCY